MGKDSGNAAERVRPGVTATGGVGGTPGVGELLLGMPGSSVVLAYTVADGGIQQIRPTPAYGGKNKSQYVTVRVFSGDGTGVHYAFGDAALPAITNTNAPQKQPSDGEQEYLLLPSDTHVRFKGDTGSGTLQIEFTGD